MLDQQTRSDPSRRVVFKATGAKRPSFSQSLSDFDLTVADTFETREAAYRLRHQVYCLERGYEPSRGGRETDDFDQDAGHILLSQRSTGRVVGTVRVVVAEDGAPSGLPLGLICPAELLATLPQGRTGEVSRFAISKELRDVTAGSSMPMASRPGAWDRSAERGARLDAMVCRDGADTAPAVAHQRDPLPAAWTGDRTSRPAPAVLGQHRHDAGPHAPGMPVRVGVCDRRRNPLSRLRVRPQLRRHQVG